MKILGAISLIISSFLLGYDFYERQTIKIKFISEYMNLVNIIKSNIRYYSLPLSRIFNKNKFDEPLNYYVEKCIDNLKKYNFQKSWYESFKNVDRNIKLEQESKNLILQFGNTIGKSDILSQIDICDAHIEMLKPYLEKAIDEKNKKGKISIIFFTGLGILISILLA